MSVSKCSVSGALVTALRISKFAGVAPLKFQKTTAGWEISLSPGSSFYGYLLTAVINIAAIAAIVCDFMLDHVSSVHLVTTTDRVVWIGSILLTLVIVDLSVCTASGRMTSIICCLDYVRQIHHQLNVWPKTSERQKTKFMIFWLISVVAFSSANEALVTFNFDVTNPEEKCSFWVRVMYTSYYCCYCQMQVQMLQFVMITFHVFNCFKAVNECLKNLLKDLLSQQSNAFPLLFDFESELHEQNLLKRKNIGVKVINVAPKKTKQEQTKPDHQRVRALNLVFMSGCDVVAELERLYGTILFLMLGSNFLHLVSSPYIMIENIYGKNPLFSETTRKMYVLSQLLWCLHHAANLVLIVEPCHRIHAEIAVTQDLVSYMLCCTAGEEPLAMELELFCRNLDREHAGFSPLHVTKLTRSLFITIFGNVITYLVIIVQFGK